MAKQGKQWAANPAAQDVKPSADLIAFMNKMQGIQDALFADGSAQPKMRYSLKPVPDQNVDGITLNIDGHQSTSAKGSAQAQQFTWPGAGQVVVTVRAGGNIPFGSYSGTWAVLRWMYDSDRGSRATKWRSGACCGRATDSRSRRRTRRAIPSCCGWRLRSSPAGVDLFDRNFFSIRCPSKVAE